MTDIAVEITEEHLVDGPKESLDTTAALPLSDRDHANIADGRETAVERTRRLFYVCCTRAFEDLVVVLFTEDVPLAQRQVAALSLFPAESIHLDDELGLGPHVGTDYL
jgi:ATP-dependent exoDNAse (exonuclease V) beta subunit